MHQHELDRELAGGADVRRSPEIQVRAQQLLSSQFRRHLAAEIDCALMKAEHPPHWRSTSVPVQASEVNRARKDFKALRQALLASSPDPAVRGVAQASCLLNDTEGPLYRRSAGGGSLSELLVLATEACALHDVGPS